MENYKEVWKMFMTLFELLRDFFLYRSNDKKNKTNQGTVIASTLQKTAKSHKLHKSSNHIS